MEQRLRLVQGGQSRAEKRAADRRRIAVPGQIVWKDAKGTTRMRWNETPIVAFNNIDAMTAPERVVSGEGIGGAGLSVVCPAARIREFTFSSASDAV